MNKLLSAVVVLPLTFGMVACSAFTGPTPVVPGNVDAAIENAFLAVDIALGALPLIPNLPPDVVTNARALDMALQAAYNQYKSNPSDTTAVAALRSAIAAATTFLENRAKPALKALHAPVHN